MEGPHFISASKMWGHHSWTGGPANTGALGCASHTKDPCCISWAVRLVGEQSLLLVIQFTGNSILHRWWRFWFHCKWSPGRQCGTRVTTCPGTWVSGTCCSSAQGRDVILLCFIPEISQGMYSTVFWVP